MKWWIFIIAGVLAVGLGAVFLLTRPANLGDLHQDIVSDYANISHVSGDALESLSSDNVILLDIREPDEFAVSHIEGAKRIDPAISADDLVSALPADVSDTTIYVYCSVGRRSSDLAARTKDVLIGAGATDVLNLEGGIFAWHNEKRPLVNANGATDYVHPYDEFWKRWVKRKDKTKYQP